MTEEKYYLTTAIAYVNGKPHIGHTLEFIQADFVARYQRAIGKDVYFLTGTDEHGQKIKEAAKEQDLSTEDLVEKNAALFQEFTKTLEMSNDDFIRTTDKKKHWPSVIKLWNKLLENDDLYKKEYEAPYCVGCEKFLLERDLDEGGNCPNHKEKPRVIKEENYFFKLSKYAKQVAELIAKDDILVVPKTRKNEILSFLEGEVQDISFSRNKKNLEWGIPVPQDDDQIMYVWCDALTNYISALDYENEGELYKKYWPADVHIIGKDILRFHAGYWPAMHLSAGIPVPKRIFVHGFVNSKGQKMSKSLGNVIDPYEQIKKFGVEVVRFYLLKDIPSYDDGDYAEEAVIDVVNNELADDLGNLLRRVTVLIEKHFGGVIPEQGSLENVDERLIKQSHFFKEFDGFMQQFEFNKAIECLWKFVRETNKYLTETEPWKEKDKARLGTILYNALESTRIVAHYLHPAMPKTAESILFQIGQELVPLSELSFSQETKGKVEKGDILFEKVEHKEEGEKFPLHLKVAKVVEVNDHPNADKLYVLKIDLGTEQRQLVAGLKEHYSKEELIGKHLIVITNLKHAKLRGVESQGMLLAGEDDAQVGVLTSEAEPGTSIHVGELANNHDKITFDEFLKLRIEVKEGKPVFDDLFFKAGNKDVTVEKVKDGAKIR